MHVRLRKCHALGLFAYSAALFSTDAEAVAVKNPDQSGLVISITKGHIKKRAPSIRKIPIGKITNTITPTASVTVFDAAELRSNHIDDVRGLAPVTPGLVISGYATFGSTPISIRGIGQNPLGIGADDAVATYLDGVYLGRAYANFFDFADIESVSVLRGPQGTLFGRNATGGAINIVTRTPDNVPSGEVETRTGNHGELLGRAVVGGPIVRDKVFLQLSVSDHHTDGFVTNRYDGSISGNQNIATARGKLIVKPNDDLTAMISLDGGRFGFGLNPKLLNEQNQSLTSAADNLDGAETGKNWGLSTVVEKDLNWAKLSSTTAFRGASFKDLIDEDGTAQDIFRAAPIEEREHQVSQEIRLISPVDQCLTWLGGLSYYQENSNSLGALALQIPAGQTSLDLSSRNLTRSYAGFADATYSLSPALHLTAGVRYTYELRRFTFRQDTSGLPIFASIPQSVSDLSDHAITPRFVADYYWAQGLMTYASISRGFKSGGYAAYDQLPATATGPTAFHPEHVWSYEVGLKADLLEHHLTIDQSVFHEAYNDLQVRIPDQYGFINVRNAASATINGAELAATYRPIEPATFNLTLSRLAARYDNFAYSIGNVQVNNAGKYLIRAPRWKGSLLAQYAYDMPRWGHVIPSAEYTFEGRTYYDDTNNALYGHGWVNIYNAHLIYEPPHRNWSVELYAQNLTNRLYVAYSVAVLGNPLGLPSQPRTFGVSTRYVW